MTLAYVSGGSSLDAQRNVILAARALKSLFPGARFSRCFRNAAVGIPGLEFINFAAELPVSGQPRQLKMELQGVEALCGRQRPAPRWAPHPMDLDLLLFGDLVQVEADLTLPRPDMLQSAHVLGPLADLAPDTPHPLAGRTIGELWQAFDQGAHPLVAVAPDLNAA